MIQQLTDKDKNAASFFVTGHNLINSRCFRHELFGKTTVEVPILWKK